MPYKHSGMELFHSSKAGHKLNGVLNHLGSMLAATHRLESIFASIRHRTYDGKNSFTVHDYYGFPEREETLDETLNLFASYAEQKVISKFSADIKNPLRLTDCWMDDPIGSGGMDIFKENTQLTQAQKKDLKSVFAPFDTVVFPGDVDIRLSQKSINAIIKEGRANAIFKREFRKREERCLAIGENFNSAASHEAVWIDLTLKLRRWTLSNNFDAFVYENHSEGYGEDSYVTLNDRQVSDVLESHRFNKHKYLQTVGPAFPDYLKDIWEKSKIPSEQPRKQTDTFWAGFSPLEFWEPFTP